MILSELRNFTGLDDDTMCFECLLLGIICETLISIGRSAGLLTGTSSSSEAKTPRRPVNRSALFKRSFVITSSFFWSSPWTLTSPWYPKVSLDGSWDRLTKLVMALQAVSMAPKRVVNSRSSGLSMATSFMKRVRVTPVVSQTSSNTGTLVCDRAIGGVSTDEWRALTPRLPVCMELNALTEEPANRIAQTENFMFVLLSIFEINCRRDVVLDTVL